MTSLIPDTTVEAIANYICFDSTFYDLGMKLGYEYEVLQVYRANNYHGGTATHQGTKDLLKDWRRKTPPEEQKSKLSKALKDANLGQLAMDYFPDVDDTREARRDVEQIEDTGTQREQQAQEQRGVNNTISASDSSTVSGNTMIGQQTNVYNESTSSPAVVHHHHITNVKQAPQPRPVIIRPSPAPPLKRPNMPKVAQTQPSTSKTTASKRKIPTSQIKKGDKPKVAQKRKVNPSPGPAPKRQKVTKANPSTSRAVTPKRKKSAGSKPKSATQPKKVTSKKKSPTAPKSTKRKAPKTGANIKKKSQKKKQSTKAKSSQRARSTSKPKKSKKK